MSQQSVLKLLQQRGKWMSSRDISDELGLGIGSVCRNLKKLLEQDEVIRQTFRIKDVKYIIVKWKVNITKT